LVNLHDDRFEQFQLSHISAFSIKFSRYDHKKKVPALAGTPESRRKEKIQKVILFSASVMLASNEVFRNSMTFLMPGVKLVVKTFSIESFRPIEQLRSLEKIWKHFSSELGFTSLNLFSMTN
jgi:hypothetical protein